MGTTVSWNLYPRTNTNYDEDNELTPETWKFIQSGPKISKLHACWAYQPDSAEAHLFLSLLHSCSSSVEELQLRSVETLKTFPRFPKLPKLRYLEIEFDWEGSFDFVRQFQLVPFQQLFPKLEKVSLDTSIESLSGTIQSLRDAEIESEFNNFTPDSYMSCHTVKTLFLSMKLCRTVLLQLMKSFPALNHLEVSPPCDRNNSIKLPYKDIFRCWPKLISIDILGDQFNFFAFRNSDAEFCGIYEEEVELLWTESDEYLSNVHYVPVRPCLSTMTGS